MAETERAYKVKVNLPSREKGDLIEIGDGVGAVENGTSVTVRLTKEQADSLRNSFGVEVEQGKVDDVKEADLTQPQDKTSVWGRDEERVVEPELVIEEEGGEQ